MPEKQTTKVEEQGTPIKKQLRKVAVKMGVSGAILGFGKIATVGTLAVPLAFVNPMWIILGIMAGIIWFMPNGNDD